MAAQERLQIEHRTPEELVRDVLSGAVRIPWFQRGFQWEASDVVKLFDSVVRGFPIGDLLFWLRPAPAQRLSVGPVEVDAPRVDAALWVVDGQQRIASLVGALVGAEGATDNRFRVHLDLDAGAFHTTGPRDDPPGRWVPVNVLADDAALRAWIGANRSWLDDAQIARADRASEAFRSYRIPVYLIESVEETAVREMFERINTGGRRLDGREVFRALHDCTVQHQVSTIEQLADVTAAMNFGALSREVATACARAFEDGAGSLGDVAAALRDTTDFLRSEAGIPHVSLLPDVDLLPMLARFIRLHGVPTGRVAVLLRRWLWRSAVASAHGDHRLSPDPATVSDRHDPVDAVSALLRAVPSYPEFHPDLAFTGHRGPMHQLIRLGLAARRPRELGTGRPVDVPTLINRGPAFIEILDHPSGTPTFANVLLASRPRTAVAGALWNASPEVAASHLVDEEGQRLLAAGDEGGFLARRAEAMAAAVRWHIAVMAEWGARDGRAVTDVIRSVA